MYNREINNFIVDKIFKTSENFLHGNRLYNNIIISDLMISVYHWYSESILGRSLIHLAILSLRLTWNSTRLKTRNH